MREHERVRYRGHPRVPTRRPRARLFGPDPRCRDLQLSDDNCDGVVDEDFVDDLGLYVADDNCGLCGNSCVDLVPNATTACVVVDDVPQCQDGARRATTRRVRRPAYP